jgi:hypothetical protein
LLGLYLAYLIEHRWGTTIDSGWSDWDVKVHCHRWTVLQVCTAQEDYGRRKRLIRARFRLRPSGSMKALALGGVLATLAALGLLAWPAALEAELLLGVCCGIWAVCLVLWWQGTRRAAQAVGAFDAMAGSLGLARCRSLPWQGN